MLAPGVDARAQHARDAWTTDTISSRTLGQRTLYVAVPDGYGGGTSRYPVLVTLDADDERQFRLWIAQAAYLAVNGPGIPSMIVVGIVNGRDRIHDMTPPATGASLARFSSAGGAAAFADFIQSEVLPRIRSQYRTIPTTILAGHSAGGLFALDVAAKRPGAFQGVIAMSPALWFNDSTLVDTYSDLLRRSPTRPRIFLSSGGLEPGIDITTRRFAERLGAAGLAKNQFSYRGYADEEHELTPMSLGDGLRFIFAPISAQFAVDALDPGSADSARVSDALASSERAYVDAARPLRLPEELPERLVNGFGYRLLSAGKAALAIAVFERNVRSYPESVNVYDSLGDGFLAGGDTTAALAQFRRAVEVAQKMGVQVSAQTLNKLHAIEAKR